MSEGSSKMQVSELDSLSSVAHYLQRIGASPRSLFRATVREAVGAYWRDVAAIKFAKADGTVTAPAGYEPTEAEVAQIKAEWAERQWPSSCPASANTALPEALQGVDPETLFEFRGLDGRLIAIQQRIDDPAMGGKSYRFWSYWDDQRWRQMEPEGKLPLYGLEKIGNHTTVFIHEGAKAARAVQRLIAAATADEKAALAAHPWGIELQGAAHVGWASGALSPGRTDWDDLQRAGVTRVYIAADNDMPGNEAVPKVSKSLSGSAIVVSAVRFDERFPSGFDLADPFPPSLFEARRDGRNVYVGPSFADCARAATWATTVNPPLPQTGRGRPPSPTYSIRSEFMAQWWMTTMRKEVVLINRQNLSKFYSEAEFSTLVRPFSDCAGGRVLDLFKANAYAQTVETVTYEPGDKEGVIISEGRRCLNTWRPSRVKPKPNYKPEDAKPWEDFLTHLFPNAEERHHVMRWCATLVARPAVRMLWAIVLFSQQQGVGKTTLCEMLRKLVGTENSQSPFAHDVVKSPFNSWIVRKRFIFVNEIYEGSSWSAYNHLKTYITDGTITANEKMVPSYEVPNWAHFILCSNSPTPLAVEDHDRRLFIPEVTNGRQDKTWWIALHAWCEAEGPSIVAAWAEAFVQAHGTVPKGDAPWSERKGDLIEDSRSNLSSEVVNLARWAINEVAAGRRKQVAFVDRDVAAWLRAKALGRGETVPKPAILRGWLQTGGMQVPKGKKTVDGNSNARVCLACDLDAEAGWAELRQYRTDPAQSDAL